MSENEDLLRRAKAAWTIKDRWKNILEDCYELALASLNPYEQDKDLPRTLNRQFDSTAPNAAIKLANRLLNDLTPPYDAWVSIEPGPVLEMQMGDEDKGPLRKELGKIDKLTNAIINAGPLVTARQAAYLDLVVAGMGCILNLEDRGGLQNPINSQAVSQSEVALEKDARGQNCLVARKRKIKIRNIKTLWPDAEIPQDVMDMSDKEKDPEITVHEITAFNKDGYKAQRSNRPLWTYKVLYEGNDGPAEIVERGYNENPWTVFQWITLPGAPYGPGPVMLALADIRTANQIVRMILMNAALALSGIYLVRDDGVLNPDNIALTQGALIPVGATGGPSGPSMVPLETGRNFDIGQIVLDEYQTRIKKWLFDNGLPPLDSTPRSATEIINRVRELTADLGAGIGRLAGDHVDYVRRIVGILARSGVLPVQQMPIDQFILKVQINSPLARAQQIQKVETVIQWMQMVLTTGGQQALLITAKVPEIMAWIAAQMGVPAELVNTATEQERMQQQLAQITAAGAAPQGSAGALQQPAA